MVPDPVEADEYHPSNKIVRDQPKDTHLTLIRGKSNQTKQPLQA